MSDTATHYKVVCHDCQPACEDIGRVGAVLAHLSEDKVLLKFRVGEPREFYWSQLERAEEEEATL